MEPYRFADRSVRSHAIPDEGNAEDFAATIKAIHDQYAALCQGNAIGALPSVLDLALENLGASLEELLKVEQKLRQQNKALTTSTQQVDVERLRYQDLFEYAAEAYVVTDSYGCIHEANREARILLREEGSLSGKFLASFIPLEDRNIFWSLLRKTDGSAGRELRLTRARNTPSIPIFASMMVVPGPHGPTGDLRWQLRPLQVEQELERYRLLVAEAYDYAIILTDIEGEILNWNAGAERIFGYMAEEAEGKHFSLLFTNDDCKNGVPAQEMRNAEANGKAADERWHLRKDGSCFWASGSLTALRGGGGVRWFAKVLRDRTTEKRSEDATAYDLRRASRIAQRFQQDMLPQIPMDTFPGMSVAALYEAAWDEAQVGGDFYDAFRLSDGQVVIVVGDVSGKGLGAAVRANEIRTALRAIMRESPDPCAALSRLNNFVCDRALLDGEREHLYASLALVILDPLSGKIACTLAGADPVLVLKAGGANGIRKTTGCTGLMLGVAAHSTYRIEENVLEPGDRLLLVTDGITETRRELPGSPMGEGRLEFLGEDGAAAIATQIPRNATVEQLCRAVLEGAHTFCAGPLADDACILAVEWL